MANAGYYSLVCKSDSALVHLFHDLLDLITDSSQLKIAVKGRSNLALNILNSSPWPFRTAKVTPSKWKNVYPRDCNLLSWFM